MEKINKLVNFRDLVFLLVSFAVYNVVVRLITGTFPTIDLVWSLTYLLGNFTRDLYVFPWLKCDK